MLPSLGKRDLFRQPQMTAVYCIRPYCNEDKVKMADPLTLWDFCSNSAVIKYCIVPRLRFRCKEFSERCREVLERAKTAWGCSLHLYVTGKRVKFFSLVFMFSLYVNVSSVCLIAVCQKVNSLPPPSVLLSWRMKEGCVVTLWHSLTPNQPWQRFRLSNEISNHSPV